MSEKSLSIKIRRARKELRIMQNAASIIYNYLAAINNINRDKSVSNSSYKEVYSELISVELDCLSVKTITELEKIIRKQKTKIREYDKRICKLQLTQSMK